MKLMELVYLVSLFFVAASIFVIYRKIKPQRMLLLTYLCGYLLILVMSNLALVMINLGWMIDFPHFYKVMMPFSLLSPVISYYYVKGSLGFKYHFKGKEYFHFLPFVAVLIHYIPFYVLSGSEKAGIVQQAIENSQMIIGLEYGFIFKESQIYILRTIQSSVYLFLSYSIITKFSKSHRIGLLGKKDQAIIKWIRFYVYTSLMYLILLVFCYIVLNFKYQGIYLDNLIEQSLFLLTAGFVFLLSSYLLINPKVLLALDQIIEQTNDVNYQALFKQIMDDIYQNQWFKDQDLTQPQLSEKVGIKSSDFLVFLKANGYSNFNAFINSIRLECFLEKANSKALGRNSIEGVAYDCGFKSSSTFYRVFRDKYGMTPKQYLAQSKTEVLENHT